MRCDLHVHSRASGMCETPGLNRICRESYNPPHEVYSVCKRLGMSLVTLTDHDSLDGAEELRGYPDFFLSEEVTCRLPSGTLVHLGVYGLHERDHEQIQQRRNDFLALLMYLAEHKLFFSVNHIFSGLTGPRESEDFQWLASYVPAIEVRNAQMCLHANASAEHFAAHHRKIGIAGSDSHTIAGIAQAYTEVSGARTADEFFAGLRAGCGRVHGVHGNYTKLTADVLRIGTEMLREKSWTVILLPLMALVPVFTAAHWLNELHFCHKWSPVLAREAKTARMVGSLHRSWENV